MTSIGRRRALRPRRRHPPGREQPRPGHHPRQQLLGRLLPRRRARRRPVLPRPLQPRARGGPEGPERDGLRPRAAAGESSTASPRRPASSPCSEVTLQGGTYGRKRVAADIDQPLERPGRLPPQRHVRELRQLPRPRSSLERYARQPDPDLRGQRPHEAHPRLRAPPRHARGRPRHLRRSQGCRWTSTSPPSSAIPTTATCGPTSTSAPATVEHRAGSGHPPQPHALRRLRPLLPELRARRRDRRPEPRRPQRLQQRHRPPERLQPDGRHLCASPTGPVRHTLLAGAEIGRQLTDNFRNTGFFNGTATSITVPLRRAHHRHPGRPSGRARPTPTTTCARNVAAAYVQDQVELSRKLQVLGGPALRPLRPRLPQQPQRRHARTASTTSSRRAPGIVFKPVDAAVRVRQLQRVLPAELRRPVLVADHGHASRWSRRSSATTRSGVKWDVAAGPGR